MAYGGAPSLDELSRIIEKKKLMFESEGRFTPELQSEYLSILEAINQGKHNTLTRQSDLAAQTDYKGYGPGFGTPTGFARNAVAEGISGVASLGQHAGRFGSYMLGADLTGPASFENSDAYRSLAQVKDVARMSIPDITQQGDFMPALGGTAGGMAPMMAASALGGMAAGPPGALLTMGAMAGGMTQQDVYENALANGMTPEQAMPRSIGAGAFDAVTSAALEGLPVARGLRAIAPKGGKAAIGLERLMGAAPKSIPGQAAAATLSGMVEEPIQEVGSQVVQNVAAGNPWNQDLAETAKMSILMGGGMSGPSALVGGIREKALDAENEKLRTEHTQQANARADKFFGAITDPAELDAVAQLMGEDPIAQAAAERRRVTLATEIQQAQADQQQAEADAIAQQQQAEAQAENNRLSGLLTGAAAGNPQALEGLMQEALAASDIVASQDPAVTPEQKAQAQAFLAQKLGTSKNKTIASTLAKYTIDNGLGPEPADAPSRKKWNEARLAQAQERQGFVLQQRAPERAQLAQAAKGDRSASNILEQQRRTRGQAKIDAETRTVTEAETIKQDKELTALPDELLLTIAEARKNEPAVVRAITDILTERKVERDRLEKVKKATEAAAKKPPAAVVEAPQAESAQLQAEQPKKFPTAPMTPPVPARVPLSEPAAAPAREQVIEPDGLPSIPVRPSLDDLGPRLAATGQFSQEEIDAVTRMVAAAAPGAKVEPASPITRPTQQQSQNAAQRAHVKAATKEEQANLNENPPPSEEEMDDMAAEFDPDSTMPSKPAPPESIPPGGGRASVKGETLPPDATRNKPGGITTTETGEKPIGDGPYLFRDDEGVLRATRISPAIVAEMKAEAAKAAGLPGITLRGEMWSQGDTEESAAALDAHDREGPTELRGLSLWKAIEISLNQSPFEALAANRHEIGHQVMDLLPPELQAAVIQDMGMIVPKEPGQNKAKRRRKLEEVFCDKFAEWWGGEKGNPTPAMLKAFEALRRMFDRLGDFLRSKGFQKSGDVFGTAEKAAGRRIEKVFRDASEGKYAKNEAKNSGAKAAVVDGPDGRRAKAGLSQRGVTVLGRNLYNAEIGKVAAKEMLQNSIDAVRSMGEGGEIHVDVIAGDRSISVYDNGLGMTRDQAETVLMDIGSSQKDEHASGGFGVAKVAIFSNARKILVETTARVGDEYEVTTLSGSGDDWAGEGLIVDSYRLPVVAGDPTKTGTKITVEMREPGEGERDGFNSWNINDYLENFIKSHTLKADITATVNGNAIVKAPKSATVVDGKLTAVDDKEDKPLTTMNYDGADVDLYSGGETRRTGNVSVNVLNNGMPQFAFTVWLPRELPMPSKITIDVKATVPPTSQNYPFAPSRESLKPHIESKVKSYITGVLAIQAAARESDALTENLRNAPLLTHVAPDMDMRVYDTSGKLSKELVQRVSESQAVAEIVEIIFDLHAALCEVISSKGGLVTGSVYKPRRSKFGGVGLGNYLGVNISGSKLQDAGIPDLILYNPLAALSELMEMSDRADMASALAEQIVSTMVHEIAHDYAHGHDDGFAGKNTRLNGITLRQQADFLGRLERLLESDPSVLEELGALKEDYNSERDKYGDDLFGKISDSDAPPGRGAREGAEGRAEGRDGGRGQHAGDRAQAREGQRGEQSRSEANGDDGLDSAGEGVAPRYAVKPPTQIAHGKQGPKKIRNVVFAPDGSRVDYEYWSETDQAWKPESRTPSSFNKAAAAAAPAGASTAAPPAWVTKPASAVAAVVAATPPPKGVTPPPAVPTGTVTPGAIPPARPAAGVAKAPPGSPPATPPPGTPPAAGAAATTTVPKSELRHILMTHGGYVATLGAVGRKIADYGLNLRQWSEQYANDSVRSISEKIKAAGKAVFRKGRETEHFGLVRERRDLDAEIPALQAQIAGMTDGSQKRPAMRDLAYMQKARKDLGYNPANAPQAVRDVADEYGRKNDYLYKVLFKGVALDHAAGIVNDHWPHRLRAEVLDELRKGVKSQLYNDLKQVIAEKILTTAKAKKQNMTMKEALAEAVNILDGEVIPGANNTVFDKRMGSFQISRSDIFGPGLIDWTIHDIENYFHSGAMAVMKYATWAKPNPAGTKLEVTPQEAEKAALSEMGADGIGPEERQRAKAYLDLIHESPIIGEDAIYRTVMNALMTATTVLKLVRLSTQIKNLTQPLSVGSMISLTDLPRAYRLLFSKAERTKNVRAGAVPGLMTDTAFHDHIRGSNKVNRALNWVSNKSLGATQSNIEKINRLVAASLGAKHAQALADILRGGDPKTIQNWVNKFWEFGNPLINGPKEAERLLREWYRMSPQQIEFIKNHATGKLSQIDSGMPALEDGMVSLDDKARYMAATEINFLGHPDHKPVIFSTNSPMLRAFWQFKGFTYNTVRQTLMKSVKSAAKGNVRVGASQLAGASAAGFLITQLVTKLMQGRDDESEFEKDWQARWVAREAEYLAQAGLISMMEDPVSWLDFSNLIVPPSFRSVTNASISAFHSVERGERDFQLDEMTNTGVEFLQKEIGAWRDIRTMYRAHALKTGDFERARFSARTVKAKTDPRGETAAKLEDAKDKFARGGFIPSKYGFEVKRIASAIQEGDPAKIEEATYKAIWSYSNGEIKTGGQAADSIGQALAFAAPLGDISQSSKTVSLSPGEAHEAMLRRYENINPSVKSYMEHMREAGKGAEADKYLTAHIAYMKAVAQALKKWEHSKEIAGDHSDETLRKAAAKTKSRGH